MLQRAVLCSIALLSASCLGCRTPVTGVTAPATSIHTVTFEAVVLHVKDPERARSELPASLARALQPGAWTAWGLPRPVLISGTLSLGAAEGETPSEIEVIDAAIRAAGDGRGTEVVRTEVRSTEDRSKLHFDVAVPDSSPGDPGWTCRPPESPALRKADPPRLYGVTPWVRNDGTFELWFEMPEDERPFGIPIRLRVGPGQAVLLALDGPRMRPRGAPAWIQTRVLLILRPILAGPGDGVT